MIDAQGWFDWAQRLPGPPEKHQTGNVTLDGVVYHSAVGFLQGVVDAVFGPLLKSVTAVIAYDGRMIQFYPVMIAAWANGNPTVNLKYRGFEFEGGPPGNESEPLRPPQTATAVRILQDLAVFKGVPVSFWQRPTTLLEHNQLTATACPSGRIPWAAITAALNEPTIGVPDSDVQADAVLAVLTQINDYKLGRTFPPLSAERAAVFARVNDLVQRQIR